MTKLGYKSWELEAYEGEKMEWWKQVWKSEGPFKENITLWLELNNKCLTWESLKKRGWIGPSWCALCHLDEEIGSHVFTIYSYAETVLKAACKELKFQGTHGGSLEQNLMLCGMKDQYVYSMQFHPFFHMESGGLEILPSSITNLFLMK